MDPIGIGKQDGIDHVRSQSYPIYSIIVGHRPSAKLLPQDRKNDPNTSQGVYFRSNWLKPIVFLGLSLP